MQLDFQKNSITCVSFILLLLFSSCITLRMGSFTAASNTDAKLEAKRAEKIKVEDCTQIVLFPPIILNQASIDSAVSLALETAGPEYDALEDVEISNRILFLFFYMKACIIVEGRPISTRKPNEVNQ